ncbi:MAG: ABC transporter permease [Lentilitoribacter sp.]
MANDANVIVKSRLYNTVNSKNRYLAAHTGRTDIIVGLTVPFVWMSLGWHDIRQRYRRSVIGPWWFTLTTCLFVGVLGTIYSFILEQDLETYLPYLAAGFVTWQYISIGLNEGCTAFIDSAHLLKQIRLPMTIHVARIAWRNLFIFLHNIPVAFAVLFYMGGFPGLSFILFPLGLFILFLNSIWISIVLGILCSRFRDIPPIVTNLVQTGFFITPVMWLPDILDDKIWIAEINPFYHLIEIIRAPIIDRPIELLSWLVSIGLLVVGFALAQWLMIKFRDRITYWL